MTGRDEGPADTVRAIGTDTDTGTGLATDAATASEAARAVAPPFDGNKGGG